MHSAPEAGGGATAHRLHCPVDDWDFDPYYTEGRCPICGWSPEGVKVAGPGWLAASRRIDWDLVGLGALLVVLVLVGELVARQAGLDPGSFRQAVLGQ